nr:MAG TPA: hypothetical protein [Caudoviricetes sp.]
MNKRISLNLGLCDSRAFAWYRHPKNLYRE